MEVGERGSRASGKELRLRWSQDAKTRPAYPGRRDPKRRHALTGFRTFGKKNFKNRKRSVNFFFTE